VSDATEVLLGVDVGTYSTKGVLARPEGSVVASHTVEHEVDLPRPGWAQQDADAVWWSDVVAVISALTHRAAEQDAVVAAVGVSAIGPCLLPLDAGGTPLRPGILYGIDTRATRQVEQMNAAIGEEAIREACRMELSSQAVGPKLWWLRDHEPDVWERAAHFTTATSYLVWRLTGRHVMDHHTAAHWMPYYEPSECTWSGHLDDASDVLTRLPALAWSDEQAGTVTEAAAAATGLPVGTPVAVGTVDALAEGLGVGVREPGDLMLMYGTTAFFILRTRQPVQRPGMWTLPGALAGDHTLAAGMATTGAVTRWFRDQFAGDLTRDQAYERLFTEALAVPPGARGLLALPYFSGERTPINDPDARGVIAGLELTHTRAEVFRALLEGVSFGIRHNLEAMDSVEQPIERMVAVGGGTRSSSWLRIVSDVAGRPQQVPAVTIGASYGDAYLAGLAAGLIGTDARWVRIATEVRPDESLRAHYDRGFARYLALYEATSQIVHELAKAAEPAAASAG
jgi:xylulokinase